MLLFNRRLKKKARAKAFLAADRGGHKADRGKIKGQSRGKIKVKGKGFGEKQSKSRGKAKAFLAADKGGRRADRAKGLG